MTTAPAARATSRRLLPVLGIGFGLAVTVGNSIGAGILRAPGEVAGHLPVTWLYLAAWVLGGLYALLGAIQLAELGAMIPRSGGQYVFSRYALGEYPGFIVGWSDWISTCGTTAAVSIVIGEYTSALFPGGAPPTAVALFVTIFFALLQWRGVKWGSRTQEITGFLKIAAFAVIVIACFVRAPAREHALPVHAPPSLLIAVRCRKLSGASSLLSLRDITITSPFASTT